MMRVVDVSSLREKFRGYQGVLDMLDVLALPETKGLMQIGSSTITKPGLPCVFYMGGKDETVLEWIERYSVELFACPHEEARIVFDELCKIFAPLARPLSAEEETAAREAGDAFLEEDARMCEEARNKYGSMYARLK